jgi:hypothetical protein
MNILKVETILPDGEDLIITKVSRKSEVVPAYTCIGGHMSYYSSEKGYPDLFDTLKDISKLGTWFFWSLMKERNITTNESKFSAANAAESRKITTAYKELYALNMVKRIKQQLYLINPKVVLPEKGEYLKVKTRWESL